MFEFLAWSPSLARLTASMLFRLQPATIAAVAIATTALPRRSCALMTAAVYGNPSRQVYCGYDKGKRGLAPTCQTALLPLGARGERRAPLERGSIAGAEHDRVDDGDHAAFRLGERQVSEPADDAAHDAAIRNVAASVRRHGDRPASVDD